MPTATNTEAFRDMAGLHPVSTGRLVGFPAGFAGTSRLTAAVRHTPEPLRGRLIADLTSRPRTLTPDSVEYVVVTDHTVIALLTVAGHVELPQYPLTALQRRHQSAAIAVLNDLPRHTLRELADRRSTTDGRPEQISYELDPPAVGALRVADSGEPTVTHGISAGADLERTRTAVAHAGLDPDRLIIITTAGDGEYGRKRHRLDLPMLCVMHRIARRHRVSLQVVGDWLDAEGATHDRLDPEEVAAGFTCAYIGWFRSERNFVTHHMNELGWTTALAQAGIPAQYLAAAMVQRDWFAHQFRSLFCRTNQRTEVFRRTTTP
jgi:hypothetical protein